MHSTIEFDQSAARSDQVEPRLRPSLRRIARSWIGSAVIAGVLALGLRTFVVETYVPDGSLFVMGDNRGNSTDSRVFRPIELSSVIGSAFGRVWPATRIGALG